MRMRKRHDGVQDVAVAAENLASKSKMIAKTTRTLQATRTTSTLQTTRTMTTTILRKNLAHGVRPPITGTMCPRGNRPCRRSWKPTFEFPARGEADHREATRREEVPVPNVTTARSLDDAEGDHAATVIRRASRPASWFYACAGTHARHRPEMPMSPCCANHET